MFIRTSSKARTCSQIKFKSRRSSTDCSIGRGLPRYLQGFRNFKTFDVIAREITTQLDGSIQTCQIEHVSIFSISTSIKLAHHC